MWLLSFLPFRQWKRSPNYHGIFFFCLEAKNCERQKKSCGKREKAVALLSFVIGPILLWECCALVNQLLIKEKKTTTTKNRQLINDTNLWFNLCFIDFNVNYSSILFLLYPFQRFKYLWTSLYGEKCNIGNWSFVIMFME